MVGTMHPYWIVRLVFLSALLLALLAPASAAAAAADHRADAEAGVSEHFPWIWALGYERPLPMGVLTGVGTSRIGLVTTVNGTPQRVTAHGLFGYRADEGDVRLIDTTLRAVERGWVPTSTSFGLTLPRKYADGVAWRGLSESLCK